MTEMARASFAFRQLANWPQTLVIPFEFMMRFRCDDCRRLLALNEPSGYMVGNSLNVHDARRTGGSAVGQARPSGREDYAEVRAAADEAGSGAQPAA